MDGGGWERDGLNGYKANLSQAKLKLIRHWAGAELGNLHRNNFAMIL